MNKTKEELIIELKELQQELNQPTKKSIPIKSHLRMRNAFIIYLKAIRNLCGSMTLNHSVFSM